MKTAYTNLVQMWRDSCDRFGDAPLFGVKWRGGWKWIDYTDFRRRVDACRAGLRARGIEPGDRVALIANNRLEWAVLAYATYGLRATFVPMYEAQLSSEWRFILRDCGAKLVACGPANALDAVRGFFDELPDLNHVVGLDLPAEDPQSFAAMCQDGAPAPLLEPAPEELACILYTSGTTGEPKGVMLSHANFAANVNAVRQVLPLEGERCLSFLPWSHAFGQTGELHSFMSAGASIAINDEIPKLIDNLAEVKPTILAAVPRIFNRIYDGVNKRMAGRPAVVQSLFRTGLADARVKAKGGSLGPVASMRLLLADRIIFSTIRERFGGRLKFVVSGSAALGVEVGEFIDALGITVYEGYGLTETSPVLAVNHPGARRMGSVGPPLPNVRIEIDHEATPDGKTGEIIAYGPSVMQGYFERPDETARVLQADGGLRTGDMGYLDQDGFLFITGRIKEQYKLENGRYVVPSPLEEKLKLSPYIANCMLFGENRPFNVCLVVPDLAAVQAWAREQQLDLGEDLRASEPVRSLIKQELATYSRDFKNYEKPRKHCLVLEDFKTENGLLTPSMKLKRAAVMQRHGAELLGLYRGS